MKFKEWLNRKREERQAMPKIPLSFWYKFYLVLVLIISLSLVLLWPTQLSALWFELWMLILKFLQTPITFQLWWFVIFVFLVARFGWYLVPVVDLPYPGMARMWKRRHYNYDEIYFEFWNGEGLKVDIRNLRKTGLRYTALQPLECGKHGNIYICESASLEITQNEVLWRQLQVEASARKKAEDELARRKTRLTSKELQEIGKAFRGGEKE